MARLKFSLPLLFVKHFPGIPLDRKVLCNFQLSDQEEYVNEMGGDFNEWPPKGNLTMKLLNFTKTAK